MQQGHRWWGGHYGYPGARICVGGASIVFLGDGRMRGILYNTFSFFCGSWVLHRNLGFYASAQSE